MTTDAAARNTWSTRSTGWAPFALVAVVVVPAIAGSLAVAEYAIHRHGSKRTVSRRTIGATTKVGSS